MPKAFLLKADEYLRYDVDADNVDAGYPKAMTMGWSGLGGTGFERDIDSVVDLGTGKAYLFKGSNYLRVDQSTNAVDAQVRTIAEAWAGLDSAGFADGIEAAVNWGSGKVYLFKADSYAGYDIGADRMDEGFPRSIADDWTGLNDVGFGEGIDAAVNWGNGKVYLFKGDLYVRYDLAADRMDDGYPLSIADSWSGLAAAGFADGVDAIWVRLTAGAQPPSTGALQPGDHVWYYNGQISTDLDIPRQAWFEGSANPTDFKGHGDEIFNFVIHAGGEIRRGRPHMKRRPGTHAWLNNNPGNITGVKGGMDLGQYRDKFNWHHFLIFPTFQAGYDAIARFLRGSSYPAKTTGVRRWPAGRYRDLGITEAFHRYAPQEDGNDPEGYGNAVAAAAGVPPTTLIRDLSDAQMHFMQDKIVEIEGTVPGDTLTRDSSELPEVIRARL
jgi:hypothetical protein